LGEVSSLVAASTAATLIVAASKPATHFVPTFTVAAFDRRPGKGRLAADMAITIKD